MRETIFSGEIAISEELTGCGLSFTLGRGNELVMHAVDSLRFLAVDRFVIDIQGLSIQSLHLRPPCGVQDLKLEA